MRNPGNPLRLLYIEDEAIVALAVVIALEDAGFEVTHVLSGKAAMMALDAGVGDYSALITDVRLPEVDGWRIARHARLLSEAVLGVSLPVIYVSGDSAHEWTANGVPGSLMVQKPVATDDLVAAVARMLNCSTT